MPGGKQGKTEPLAVLVRENALGTWTFASYKRLAEKGSAIYSCSLKHWVLNRGPGVNTVIPLWFLCRANQARAT